MAREVIIRMLDDFDPSKVADETVEFTFENVTYVLDMTTKNAEEFRGYLAPYMEHAHERIKVKKNAAQANPETGQQDGLDKAERAKIRKWAKKMGMNCSTRGIVAKDIRAAWDAAHGGHGGPIQEGLLDHLMDKPPSKSDTQVNASKIKPSPTDDTVEPPQTPRRVPVNRLPDHVPNSQGISAHMREWAKANGHSVSKAGYISKASQDAYHAAMLDEEIEVGQLHLNGHSVSA